MSAKNKTQAPAAPQVAPKVPVSNPNPESTLKKLLDEQGMDVISKLILIEMDKRMHDMTHKIHLAIQKDLDALYYSGIENKIESRVRDEVESRVTRVIPDIKTTILQSVQRQTEANPDVHQESREKKRRLNEEDQRNNKHLEEQLTKFSDTLQMVLNQNKEMQKRIEQLESELKKNQATREEVPDT